MEKAASKTVSFNTEKDKELLSRLDDLGQGEFAPVVRYALRVYFEMDTPTPKTVLDTILKSEIVHTFMLLHQRRFERAPSYAVILYNCPLWKNRQGVKSALKTLAEAGLIEQRPVNEPEQRAHNKWWAVELCADRAKRQRQDDDDLCINCWPSACSDETALWASQ